jgi:glycosyltransferase involved in cell wall biosynthesis
MFGQRALSSEQAMLRLADVVVAPTEELAGRFRAAGAADMQVVENFLPPTFQRPRMLPNRGVTIGWAAMAEHRWDYDQLRVRDALVSLMERHLHVRVLAIGMDLAIDSPRYEWLPWQAYDALPQQLSRCDVALAPLADVPFNRTRSNVKLKEYAGAGTPWLASPIGPYAGLGEAQGGRLVADGDWAAALHGLIVDEAARRRLAANGRRWAAEEVVLEHVDELERLFEHAAAVAAG